MYIYVDMELHVKKGTGDDWRTGLTLGEWRNGGMEGRATNSGGETCLIVN